MSLWENGIRDTRPAARGFPVDSGSRPRHHPGMTEDKPKCSVFCGLSLDGFIAREDHSIDWLTGGANPSDGPPEDMGYDAFFSS